MTLYLDWEEIKDYYVNAEVRISVNRIEYDLINECYRIVEYSIESINDFICEDEEENQVEIDNQEELIKPALDYIVEELKLDERKAGDYIDIPNPYLQD